MVLQFRDDIGGEADGADGVMGGVSRELLLEQVLVWQVSTAAVQVGADAAVVGVAATSGPGARAGLL